MPAKIQIIFYSMYGHVYQMAEAVAAGARDAGAEVRLWQVPELVPDEILEKSGAHAACAAFAHVPVAIPTQLAEADAVIFGTPTRFGNMAAQMRNFLDQTGGLWANGALIGKVGSVFASTASQHGGQETTLVSFHLTLLHHGMIVVGLPYAEQRLANMAEISGGTPYGATTLAGIDGSRQPSENERAIARFQGRHVAQITNALSAGRKHHCAYREAPRVPHRHQSRRHLF
jgi:NAD(P)H dehydrogenase (quinone)